MSDTILVVDDEILTVEMITHNLMLNGYHVLTATDGARALQIAVTTSLDLIILDINLPEMDGVEVCQQIRQASGPIATVPIIMLTANGHELDKEIGLDSGADDYVTKPFEQRELLARVHALLRRTKYMPQASTMLPNEVAEQPGTQMPTIKEEIIIGPLQIDLAGRQVICRGKVIDLQFKQFELLLYLVHNRGRVLTHDQLLHHIWGYNYTGDPRTVPVHIRWLREKIEEDPSHPSLIRTIRGVGYSFNPSPTHSQDQH